MNPDLLLQHFDQLSEAPKAVPRLRRFILDLAVRGKLVEQDPEDEPAGELLKRIRAIKKQFPVEHEIVSTDSDSNIFFEIPKSWQWIKATESVLVVSDKGRKVQTKDVLKSGRFPVVDQGKIFIRGYCDDAKKVIDVDSPIILFGDHTREIKFIDFDFVVGAEGVKLLKPIELYPRYYFLALQWVPLHDRGYGRHYKILRNSFIPLPPLPEQHRIVAKVNELMALCDDLDAAQAKREKRRDRLVAATLHGLGRDETGRDGSPSRPQLGHPPSPKQPGRDVSPKRPLSPKLARGGAFGEHALPIFFNHLSRLTTRPEHIRQLRQTILNLAVCGKLVPQDPNDEPVDKLISQIQARRSLHTNEGSPVSPSTCPDPLNFSFSIPKSWKWVSLSETMNIIMGQSPPGETYNTRRDGVPLINGPLEFSEGPFGITVLNQYTSAPTKLCKEGDLLLCVRGSTTGRTNIVGFDACIGRGVAALQSLYPDQFVRFFIWSMREQIIEMGRGIAFPSISRRQIEDLPIPLPPLPEQHRIVAQVKELMALCDELEDRITTNSNSRRQILEATFAGALAKS